MSTRHGKVVRCKKGPIRIIKVPVPVRCTTSFQVCISLKFATFSYKTLLDRLRRLRILRVVVYNSIYSTRVALQQVKVHSIQYTT